MLTSAYEILDGRPIFDGLKGRLLRALMTPNRALTHIYRHLLCRVGNRGLRQFSGSEDHLKGDSGSGSASPPPGTAPGGSSEDVPGTGSGCGPGKGSAGSFGKGGSGTFGHWVRLLPGPFTGILHGKILPKGLLLTLPTRSP